MAEYLIKDSTLIEITDAIREKTGKVNPIPVLNLANEIKSLQASSWKLPTLDGNYPEDVNVKMVGEDPIEATFNIAVTEPGEPAVYTYQWYMDGKAIEGETGITYTVTGIKDTVSHKIYCEVTSAAGVVNSRIATLNVQYHYLPELDSSYPANATVVIKNSVTCKVVISANGNPMDYTYQWYVGGNAVSGATESSYQYKPSTIGASKVYCIVTNAAGSVTSRTATITTNPVYLYNRGDQCTSLTGGWQKFTTHDDFYATKDVTFGANYMTMSVGKSNAASFAINKTTVDLTNYSKITFVLNHTNSSTYDYSTFFISTDNRNLDLMMAAKVASVGLKGGTVNAPKTIDISKLTGRYYIVGGVYKEGSGTTTIDLYEVYLS